MIRKALIATLLCSAPIVAQAHEVWIERDGSDPARIYLGEPADVQPEGGDPEFHHLKAPKLVPASTAELVRKTGYIEVAAPAGDVRAIDDAVFAPWGEEGKKEGVIYYARAGRTETTAALPLELVPTVANGSAFTLIKDGKPVAGAEITVVSPDKWTKELKTDASGVVVVPAKGKGRYILVANQKEEGDLETAGVKVKAIHRISTTTFVTR